jgi:suppressor of ftsI
MTMPDLRNSPNVSGAPGGSSAGRRAQLDRRRFLGFTGGAVIAAAIGAGQPARAQDATPQPEEYVSENGVLKASIAVTREKVDIGGEQIEATVYNGAYVGPALRLRPGERLELSLTNKLDQITNLHFHGMHVSPSGVADNVFIMVEPGATQVYVVEIPENHPSGTFWYHTHAHPYTEPQVFGGLAALLIVDGLNELLPPELHDIAEQSIVLKDY